MSTRPATWKVVPLGAALAGLGVAGADHGPRGQEPDGIVVDAAAEASATPADASPESADSPDESATDSPGDVAPVDASPETADSPEERAWDTADETPDDDTPDD
jgi:hypothetical protein